MKIIHTIILMFALALNLFLWQAFNHTLGRESGNSPLLVNPIQVGLKASHSNKHEHNKRESVLAMALSLRLHSEINSEILALEVAAPVDFRTGYT